MPLLLSKHIAEHTRMAVWKIEESESFFLEKINLQQHINHPHKRLQHLAGRYLLSLLFPSFPYQNVMISDAGKPYLFSGEYQFSISHCGDYAAAIVSTQEQAGIDIELFSSKTERVKHKYLSADEFACIHSLRSLYPRLFTGHQIYTLCWCAKEAVYKWWGKGKIDFKKNIVIRSINIEQQELSVLFAMPSFSIELTLSLLLLNQLSIVWTATSKNY